MSKHTNLSKLLVKIFTTILIVVIPLYPKFPFIKIPGTFVSVRIEDFMIFISLVIVLWVLKAKKTDIRKNIVIKAMLIYLFIGFISLLSSVLITKETLVHISFLHWVRRIEYFVPFLLGMIALSGEKENRQYYAKVILIVLGFLFFYGIGQKYFKFPIIITQNQEYSKGVALYYIEGSHINSTFAGHYDLASYLILILPSIVLGIAQIKNIITKLTLTVFWFAGLWLLVNSASRISLVSYLLSSILGLFILKKYKFIVVAIFISILFTGFSSNLLSRYIHIYDVTVKSIQKTGNSIQNSFFVYANEDENQKVSVIEDRSTNIRLVVEWPRALRAFIKNPLLGTGYSSITLATDNDYLRLLGETGVLGFLSFSFILISFVISILKTALKSKMGNTDRIFVIGMLVSIFGILINAIFIDIFEASKFAISFWLFGGMVFGIVKDYESSE